MTKRRESAFTRWRVAAPAILLSTFILLGAAPAVAAPISCDGNTVTAQVVALDQPLMYNRLGAQNVNGMMYALRRDVVDANGIPLTEGGAATPGAVRLRPDRRPRPIVLRVAAGSCLRVEFQNLLAFTSNPRNADHAALQIDDQVADRTAGFRAQGLQLASSIMDDGSAVGRNPSSLVGPGGSAVYTLVGEHEGTFVVTNHGSQFGSEALQGNGANGLVGVVTVEPKGARFYRSQVTEEELRLATTTKLPNGQPVLDYGAKYPAVEPWVSEGKAGLPVLAMVTAGGELVHTDINAIIAGPNADGSFPASTYPLEKAGKRNPSLPNRLEAFREFTVLFHDEPATAQAFPFFYADPVLRHTLHGVRDGFMINYGSGGIGSEIIANRLGVGPMHDCLNCAYEEFFLTSYTVGDPAMIVDVPANVGLETLAPGVAPPPGTTGPKATVAYYPDDPSNVHHTYIGDFVKYRNLHTGAEQHVFHLHNHQWLFNPNDDNSNYIDAQGIGPGSGYTYELNYMGAGNRNKSAGDAIFHCHFYPHFAQGMWEHMRIHDVLETGTPLAVSGADYHDEPFALRDGRPAQGARALPDPEILAGTPIPAVVPMPGKAMAPMPGKVEVVASPYVTTASDFHAKTPGVTVPVGSNAKVVDRAVNPGFPFWVAGIEEIVGQRPTTPPLDMLTEADAAALGARDPQADPLFGGRAAALVATAGGWDGGLPRHALHGKAAGGHAISVESPYDFSKIVERAKPEYYPEEGTDVERAAMAFHATREHPSYALKIGAPPVAEPFVTNGAKPMPSAPYHDPCIDDRGQPVKKGGSPYFWGADAGANLTGLGPVNYGSDTPRTYKGANIQIDAVFNKVGYHFSQERIIALWDDVLPTINKEKAPEPFAIRFNTLDCGKYLHTNLVPAFYELDDYQVRTPTDIIGQHIHLPKWDLTTTDGSANGWNYEDGTFSPGAVQERIHAINVYNEDAVAAGLEPVVTKPRPDGTGGGLDHLKPLPHPYFGAGLNDEWLGARTTLQRWFFDPVVNAEGKDRGLGIVFTHDHYGPSTHQQIGLYASVLAEPAGSTWVHNETGAALHTRHDGGPTTWQAIIKPPNAADSFREFWFQASDFQHAYEAGTYVGAGPDGRPNPTAYPVTADTFRHVINPSVRLQKDQVFPDIAITSSLCPSGLPRPCPEAISVSDPGMFVVNYRNEPVALRTYDPKKIGPDGKPGMQADGDGGDLAYALQTRTDRAIPQMNTVLGDTPYPVLTGDVKPGDPFTPVMRAYAGDRIRVKVQMGGHEEELNTTVHGMKWLQAGSGHGAAPNSGWRNAQAHGISEQFTLSTPVTPFLGSSKSVADYAYAMSGSQDGWWNGVWGLIRTYSTKQADLPVLPGAIGVPLSITNARDFTVTSGGACPKTAPLRAFDLSAVLANDVLPKPAGVSIVPADLSATQHVGGAVSEAGGTLVYNPRATLLSNGESGPLHDPTAMLLVHTDDLEAKNPNDPGCYKLDPKTGVSLFDPKAPTCPVKLKAGVSTEPIALRAAAGDCIEVSVRNRLPGDVNANGLLDDVPDLANLTALHNVVLRDRFDPQGTTFFQNNLIRPSSRVGLHPQLVSIDVTKADGMPVGRNNDQTAAPGFKTFYRWYAGDLSASGIAGSGKAAITATPIEFGGVNLTPADKMKQGQKGLVGTLIVEPQGSAWAEDAGRRSAASVGPDANKDGKPDSISHRSFSVAIQKHLSMRYASGAAVGNIGGEGEAGIPEDAQDAGQMAINNGSEPLWFRFGMAPNAPFGRGGAGEEGGGAGFGDIPNVHLAYSNTLTGNQDPATPVFTAAAGQQVKMHVMSPHGASRGTTFNLHGHVWQRDPYFCPGSAHLGIPGKCTPTEMASRAIGHNPLGFYLGGQESIQPYTHFNLVLPSAGGVNAVPGDYLFRDQGGLGNAAGLWGLLRVQ